MGREGESVCGSFGEKDSCIELTHGVWDAKGEDEPILPEVFEKSSAGFAYCGCVVYRDQCQQTALGIAGDLS